MGSLFGSGIWKVILIDLPIHLLLEVIYFVFRCRPRKQIKGKHVLVTGGADGIGAEYVRKFASMGNTVHILDYNSEALSKIEDELIECGYMVKGYQCDMTNWEEVLAVYEVLKAQCIFVSYLVNNVGVAFGKNVVDYTHTQIQHEIHVNLISHIWMINLFLPKMIERNEGHVINMSSLAALLCCTNAGVYCATKAGLYQLSEQLQMQLVNTDIKVTAVCPFFIRTKFIAGLEDEVESRGVPLITPRQLVELVMVGIQENKKVIIAPPVFKFLTPFLRHLPQPIMEEFYRNQVKQDLAAYHKYVGREMSKIVS